MGSQSGISIDAELCGQAAIVRLQSNGLFTFPTQECIPFYRSCRYGVESTFDDVTAAIGGATRNRRFIKLEIITIGRYRKKLRSQRNVGINGEGVRIFIAGTRAVG